MTPDLRVSCFVFIQQNLVASSQRTPHKTRMTTRPVPKAADFVIVGGATAGWVLANRLSEHPNAQILVLESGKSITQDPTVQDPNSWMSLLGPETVWQLETVPQVRE
jgi:GMC oxidoreductase